MPFYILGLALTLSSKYNKQKLSECGFFLHLLNIIHAIFYALQYK